MKKEIEDLEKKLKAKYKYAMIKRGFGHEIYGEVWRRIDEINWYKVKKEDCIFKK